MWKILDKITTKLSEGALWISVLSLAVIMILATADIISTKFFSHPIPSTAELIEDLDIPLVFMGMAYVQMTRGHMAGPVFEKKFPPGVNRAIVLIGNILGFVVSVLISWKTFPIFHDAVSLSKVSSGTIPYSLWPFSFLTLLGFGLLALAFIVSSIRILLNPERSTEHS